MINFKELFDNIDIPPRISLYITILCFIFVMANNHIYLRSVEEREKQARDALQLVGLREDGNTKKERTLRLWEMELLQREKDVSKILEEIRRAKASKPKSIIEPSSPR